MICDKCGGDVEPQNNALLYDAALVALAKDIPAPVSSTDGPAAVQTEYVPMTIFAFTQFPVFTEGQIIPGDAAQSIRNTMCTMGRGRHLYGTGDCEGSPSRRLNIEQGTWGNGRPMGELADAAQEAYKLIQSIETP
jgi:hypothetical protein